jgi:hypothetical protein
VCTERPKTINLEGLQSKLQADEAEPVLSTPDEFREFIATEMPGSASS